MIDYDAIARRALDVPLTETQDANLRVWADQLEAAGDARGALISLEYAMRAEPARRRVLRKAAHDHVVAHGDALLGPLIELARVPHAIQLDWRAGHLYGLSLDARHASKALGRREADVFALALGAPVVSDLRRLVVRAWKPTGKTEMFEHALQTGLRVPPLEELIIHTSGAPSTYFSQPWRDHPLRVRLVERYPALRMFVDEYVIGWPVHTDDASAAIQATRAAEPATKAGRAVLGRAMLRVDVPLRTAALERVEQLGPRAFALVETLMILLRSDNVAHKLPIARALAKIGDAAGPAWQALASITGRTDYSEEARGAAGVALGLRRDGWGLSPSDQTG